MLLHSKHFLIVFSFTILTMLLNTQSVFACSCGDKPTVLESYKGAELIVATKFVSVNKVSERQDEDDDGYIKSVKMVVERVFKGDVKVGDELIIGQGDGVSCAMVFEEESIGNKILFYLNSPRSDYKESNTPLDSKTDKYSRVSFCGRSVRNAGKATDDLLFLEKADQVSDKSRVSGTLYNWRDLLNTSEIYINISGKDKTYKIKTDKNGVYEIYDLPKGEYTLEPQIPKGWKIDGFNYFRGSPSISSIIDRTKHAISVGLREKEHIGINFSFAIDNAIRGKVLSPTGKPMENVCLDAVSVESKEKDYRGYRGCTNEKGEYEIDEISPGNYFLVLNGDGKIDSDEPFNTLFYPGVSNRKNSGVVSIEIGKFLRDIDIQIPKLVELIQVSGKLIYSNEKPFPNEWVEFKPTETDKFDSSRTKTDEQGNFSLKVPKGASGFLSSNDYVYSGEYKNCEKLEELLRKSGERSKRIETEEFRLKASIDLYDVKLVFPFPKCEKTKN